MLCYIWVAGIGIKISSSFTGGNKVFLKAVQQDARFFLSELIVQYREILYLKSLNYYHKTKKHEKTTANACRDLLSACANGFRTNR
jgi:hypothetical protein